MARTVTSTIPRPVERKLAWSIQNGVERFIALILFVLLFPVMAVIWIVIRLIDRQDPFFRQQRVGQGGRVITLLKFRTMRMDSDPYALKPDNDSPAITRMGKALRPRAIDEFPQLWNVITGEMALVGPRPEMDFIVDGYSEVEAQRLVTKPGLTGLWQLSRVRDRAIHHHMEYDLFYVYNRSAGMDLWLLWRTFLFAAFGMSTKIRLAVQRWERDSSWRRLVPERAMSIPPRSTFRLATFWVSVLAGIAVVLFAPGLVSTFLARSDLYAARSHMIDSRKAIERLRPDAAALALSDASARLDRADSRLRSWTMAPARLIPTIPGNIEAVLAFVDSGRHLVLAGRAGLQAFKALPTEDGKLVPPISGDQVNLAPLSSAAIPARRMQTEVARASIILESVEGPLLPQVEDARASALLTLSTARRQADAAGAAATLLPRMLGAEGPRTWIVGAENLAELRGRGGYMGAFGILTADKGKLSFGSFTATDKLPRPDVSVDEPVVASEIRDHYDELGALVAWQNFTMSPRFASGAALLTDRLTTVGYPKASGVIALDPVALSYLLDVTGPVNIAGIPEPLTKDNIVDWTLNRAYFQFSSANQERKEVLGEVADAVWARLLGAGDVDGRKLADRVGKALSQRHMVLYSTDGVEQRLIERLGVDGGIDDQPGDYILPLTQNFGEGKMDFYMRRSFDQTVTVTEDGSARSNLTMRVENTAPADGSLPDYIGGARPGIGLEAGWARSYISIMLPERAIVDAVRLDGETISNVDDRAELGKRLVGIEVKTPPQGVSVIELDYRVADAVTAETYSLRMQNQATVSPDRARVRVTLPDGVRIGRRQGFVMESGSTVSWEGSLDRSRTLSVQMKRSRLDRFRDTLRGLIGAGDE